MKKLLFLLLLLRLSDVSHKAADYSKAYSDALIQKEEYHYGMAYYGFDWPFDDYMLGYKFHAGPMPADTVYTFGAAGGWGTFDWICSVYTRADTCWAEGRKRLNIRSPLLEEDHVVSVLSRQEWNRFRFQMDSIGFWSSVIQNPDSGRGIDGDWYTLEAIDGNRYKRISWQDPFLQDSGELRAAILLLFNCCGDFISAPKAIYEIQKDSVFVRLKGNIPGFFQCKSICYQLGDIKIQPKSQYPEYQFHIHRKHFKSLLPFTVIYEMTNGTVLTRKVSDIKRLTYPIDIKRVRPS